jgi:G3E family GTPase
LYEHKKLVELAEKSDKEDQEAAAAREVVAAKVAETHSHDHDSATCTDPTHDHSHDAATCTDPTHDHSHDAATCTDPTHDHSHDAATCTDPTHDHSHDAATCTDPTHDHSHDTATCTDPTHDHSHDAATCTDPTHDHSHDAATCTDPTHDHSHSSTSHAPGMTTAEERFGISSFVYKRRLPFHPGRFSLFLQGLGKLSVKGISEIASTEAKRASTGENDALLVAKKALLRSKGFVWMGTSKTAAYFMSHAGQYLELMVLGRWWADISQADWPKGSEDEITVDFDGHQGKC